MNTDLLKASRRFFSTEDIEMLKDICDHGDILNPKGLRRTSSYTVIRANDFVRFKDPTPHRMIYAHGTVLGFGVKKVGGDRNLFIRPTDTRTWFYMDVLTSPTEITLVVRNGKIIPAKI